VGVIIAEMMEKVNRGSQKSSWAHHTTTPVAVLLCLCCNLPGEVQYTHRPLAHMCSTIYIRAMVLWLYLCSGHQADNPYLNYCDDDHLLT
jgi:hypothetical protein